MNIAYIEGGSTAFGMLDLEMGGWPNRLHVAKLRETVKPEDTTMVMNRAMPGRTLPGILRDAEANMQYFRRFGSVAAVLQTGMNEVKIFQGSRTPIVPARLFRELIAKFCNLAQEQACTPILVGSQPIDTSRDNPTFSGAVIKDELLIEYGSIMSDFARNTGISYVDTRAVFEDSGRPTLELLGEDGYHPNAIGHAILANAVDRVLTFG